MTAKHSPATSLPWDDNAEIPVFLSRPNFIVYGARESKSGIPEKNSAYLLHAANAYPKLVAAIKGQYAGTFEQLLRELGEAE